MKVLIVRTSSLGDIIHSLPAVTDLYAHYPDAHIDWVAEEALVEIPTWHPAVRKVIPVAHRRWRKAWWSEQHRLERTQFRDQLRQEYYDAVIDLQGWLKSSWVASQALGKRYGFSWTSTKEPLATLFYHKKLVVSKKLTAIERSRCLLAKAMGYSYEEQDIDYGLQNIVTDAQRSLTNCYPYAIIMPSASTDKKLWNVSGWHAVFDVLHAQGLHLKLLAGTAQEKERATRLIQDRPYAEVLPRMNLTDTAHALSNAQLMVGLDSGLTHLSAALGRPTVGIYCASPKNKFALQGQGFVASLGDMGKPPSIGEVVYAVNQALNAAK